MKQYLFETQGDYEFIGESFSISKSIKYAGDDATWPRVLKEFVRFLSHDYGYDLSAQVAVIDADGSVVPVSEVE